jgi:hypothetical protein
MLGDGCPNCGCNNENNCITNHKLVNGNLEITALKQGDKYTSSRLTTKDKKKNFSTVILKLEQSCLLKEFGLHSGCLGLILMK